MSSTDALQARVNALASGVSASVTPSDPVVVTSALNNAIAPKQNARLPSLFTNGAPAYITDLFAEFLTGKKFGINGDGTDETGKINSALAEAVGNGKKLRLGAGSFGVNPSAADRCLTATGGFGLEGEGRERTVIFPLSGATSAHSILKVAPTAAANLEFMELRNLMIYPGASGTIYGGKALHIDTSLVTGGLNLAFLRLDHCYFGAGNDYSVYIYNTQATQLQGSPSNSLFTNCIFSDGFFLRGGGDSMMWQSCAFRTTSTNRSTIDLGIVVDATGNGASSAIFDTCNVGGKGGIVVRSGRRIEFRNIDAELGNVSGENGSPNGAFLDIMGDISRVYGVKIVDGLLAIFGDTTCNQLIRVGNARDVDIDRMELSNGKATAIAQAINITPQATDTHVGWLSSLDVTKFTNLTLDAGTGTRGVIQSPASLGTGFTNLGSGFAPASYRKDRYGVVTLDGVLAVGTVTSGETIFTLPAGFVPFQGERRIAYATIGGAQSSVLIDIQTTGAVVYQGPTTATQLSLGGISFQTLSFHTSS